VEQGGRSPPKLTATAGSPQNPETSQTAALGFVRSLEHLDGKEEVTAAQEPCCLISHQAAYTRTTQALPGGHRS
jgi:hypothetical protein